MAISRNIPYKKCNQEDYDEFHPVLPGYVSLLDSLKKEPKRGLYCIDWKEANINLQGNERNANHERLEILVLPCN